MAEVLSTTESVCPECLGRIPALLVQYGEDVYLEKTCPHHGDFQTIIWRGKPAFASWVRPKTPSYPEIPFTRVKYGCPYDCGLCPDHRQQPCCVLLEVTQRCDLGCPVCFANSAHRPLPDPTLDEIETWYLRLLEAGGPFNIQISGGEPCMRDDLPEIIRMGRSFGYSFFQLNTNGLRLAHDITYLKDLKQAGLSTVFLQFDGTHDEIYSRIRSRCLIDKKLETIENCAGLDIGVVLVPTLIPGINTGNIGNILRLGLANMPAVRGVHFQPVSYFGRYPESPSNEMRITIPEVIRAIETQTDGLIPAAAFCPPGGENALCSFHGNFVMMPDDTLIPLNRHNTDPCCCRPTQAAEGAVRSREFVAKHWASPEPQEESSKTGGLSLGAWDDFLERQHTHTFCISGMAFQDAWTLDLNRLRDCYIDTVSQDGRLVPFCAFNLTDRSGRSLYRKINSTFGQSSGG